MSTNNQPSVLFWFRHFDLSEMYDMFVLLIQIFSIIHFECANFLVGGFYFEKKTYSMKP
jgi:hypothetical protein